MSEASETYHRAFESISQELQMNRLEGRDAIDHLQFVETEGDPGLWVAILRTMGYGLDRDGRIVDLLDRHKESG